MGSTPFLMMASAETPQQAARWLWESEEARLIKGAGDDPDEYIFMYPGTWTTERDIVVIGEMTAAEFAKFVEDPSTLKTPDAVGRRSGPVACWRLRFPTWQVDCAPTWVFFGRASS